LLEFEPIWNELFPAEQARIVELLVERVDLQPDAIDLRLRIEGLTSLLNELRGKQRLAPGGGMTTTAAIKAGHFSGPTLSRDGHTMTVRIPIVNKRPRLTP
jgi:hypothetical protein